MNFTTEIIVCTYNGSRFIVDQLESILVQTIPVDKISIYDDQSTDRTLDRINEFVSQLSFEDQLLFNIQVNSSNLGYAQNFSRAIFSATEDILFLCDQDDIWEPNKVEVLLDLINSYPVDMVFSDGLIIDSYGENIDNLTVLESYGINVCDFNKDAFKYLMKRNYINGAAAAIRRMAAQSALPLPCDMPHDYWLGIWCSLHEGVLATSKPLYKYRQHDANVIGMGLSNPLYALLGLWRSCNKSRERELLIWQAIVRRISTLSCQPQVDVANNKLSWMSHVVPKQKRSWYRASQIFISVLNGNYKMFSPKNSFLRDFFSLVRGGESAIDEIRH
jgi:glycosyltransferase involved in cell wall biosynthesis